MTIDFSKITIYEVFALILSTIAILIPIVQWAWKKWVTKPVLYHLPTGRAFLFINRSGSYMQIEGVFEAQNKAISVKNISLQVSRVKDAKTLNLRWSTFTSPVSQRIVGSYSSMTETAHPFRIEADSISCAFIEFSDFYDSFWKAFQPYYDTLVREINEVKVLHPLYDQVYSKYLSSDSYMAAKVVLEKELFWEIGQYEVRLDVQYGKNTAQFTYVFSVNSDDYEHIKSNLVETLVVPLKNAYGIPLSIQPVQVELRPK